MISQSLEVGLIPFLLGLLDSRLEFVDNASAVKAQIVAALKGMTHNLNYGDRVTQILLKHPVWAEFKDQRHDLFITDTNIRGYLTGEWQHDNSKLNSYQLPSFSSIPKVSIRRRATSLQDQRKALKCLPHHRPWIAMILRHALQLINGS